MGFDEGFHKFDKEDWKAENLVYLNLVRSHNTVEELEAILSKTPNLKTLIFPPNKQPLLGTLAKVWGYNISFVLNLFLQLCPNLTELDISRLFYSHDIWKGVKFPKLKKLWVEEKDKVQVDVIKKNHRKIKILQSLNPLLHVGQKITADEVRKLIKGG